MRRAAEAKALALDEQAVESVESGPVSPRRARTNSAIEEVLCVRR